MVGMTHHPSSRRLEHTSHANALANLLSYLPRLVHDESGQIDVHASDPILVALLAETAAGGATTLTKGIEVVAGLLEAVHHAGRQGTVQPQAMDALGLLIAEIVNLATALTDLSKQCLQR